MATPPPTLLIGVDGIGTNQLREWISDESRPALSQLGDDGGFAPLESTHPPWTPCAWPSLLSGRNPGKHGVFDFFTRDGYDKRLVDRTDVDSPYLFEAADSSGLTSVVINYPVTYPASNLENGALVPGYLAREDVRFHPEGLREEYESEYGEYLIYPEYGVEDDAVSEYVEVARHRRDMARFLDERYDWDLMAVQFQVTDSVFHDLEDREEIRRVLEEVDGFIGDIVDLSGDDTTVIVASDHGMGEYDWTFYVNSWLAEHGYCETTEGDAQYFRQRKATLKGVDEEPDDDGTLGTVVKTAVTLLSRVGLPPQRIHRGLSTLGLAGTVERLLPEAALVAAQNQVVDHANSTAFQLYFNSLGIHLNVVGRDPAGTVSEREYDAVRDELMGELEQVRDPDGNLVFDAVRPREAVYEGKHLEDAPDILLVPRDYRYDVSGSVLDTFRRFPHMNHKPDGILLSNRSLEGVDRAEIYDVAPTVAAALGVPVDTDTDGDVLLDIEERVERQNWDELADGCIRTRSDSDTSSVEDRLSAIGYME